MRVSLISVKQNEYSFKENMGTKAPIDKWINEGRMVDHFIRLAKIDSGSIETSGEKTIIPSTEGQTVLAKLLKQELEDLGLKDVEMDEHSIVTATLESNTGDGPVLGFLAHMDTSSDVPTANVNPQIHDYKGGDIKLAGEAIIPSSDLKDYVGQKIITSDGTTLLGADDKAGIAEIFEAIRVFQEHPELKHPKIRIGFTPDEEVGEGISVFDMKKFGADLAYTVDGDIPHVIETGSFNAFNPEVVIEGINAHPGYAKEKMINSVKAACWIVGKLPKDHSPETTEGRQGYIHPKFIQGKEDKTTLKFLVRNHDLERAKKDVAFLEELCRKAEQKFGVKISFNPGESYKNMAKFFEGFPEVITYAQKALKMSGFSPKQLWIRGGTDGSHLSLKGLLTPNIGAGGLNFHSLIEFLPILSMNKCTENIINVARVWADNSKKVMPKILQRRVHM